jgi:hypothetical protein
VPAVPVPQGKGHANLGSPRNIALAVLMVIAATSPLWGGVAYRMLRGHNADIAGGKAHPPAVPGPARPQPAQRAWDEGDWTLPEGGPVQVEPIEPSKPGRDVAPAEER